LHANCTNEIYLPSLQPYACSRHKIEVGNGRDAQLWDAIIAAGGFAWQMFLGGPDVLPGYYPGNGTINRQHMSSNSSCSNKLKIYCQPKGYGDEHALIYSFNANANNATFKADQLLAIFLLTRGPFAYLGYDYRGPWINYRVPYPRPKLWDQDFGTPSGNCVETAPGSNVWKRSWSKAEVTWDCNRAVGTINRI
jgi:hypothetical protein